MAPGHLSQPENYNEPTPSRLLPAQLAAEPHTARPTTNMGDVVNLTHPLFERYGKDLATVLQQVPVYKYWPVLGAGKVGLVLLRYADGAGLARANVQGAEGRQGALLDDASVSPCRARRERSAGSAAAWNEFPLIEQYGWGFLALHGPHRAVPFRRHGGAAQFRRGRERAVQARPHGEAVKLRDQRSRPEAQGACRRLPANTWKCPRPPRWDSGW